MMSPKYLVRAGLIAALYALLTVALAPISSGLIQCRVSEALSVLPYFTPAAVPGLFVGCALRTCSRVRRFTTLFSARSQRCLPRLRPCFSNAAE